MHVKKGNKVKVIAGKYKGHVGEILSVYPRRMRVEVEGLPPLKRHFKADSHPSHPQGGIGEKPRSLHVSNVMLMTKEMQGSVSS
ncbi:MAG: 50S ribosomal protein L24 [Myxococcota bacterium]